MAHLLVSPVYLEMSRSFLLVCLGLALAAAMPGRQEEPSRDVNGAQVLRVNVERLSDLQFLQWLEVNTLLDFWTPPRRMGNVDIMARRWDLPMLKQTLRRRDMQYTITVVNVAEFLKVTEEQHLAARSRSTKMDWTNYQTYDEINMWMEQLALDYPTLVTVTDVGLSYEGRVMKLLKISNGNPGNQKIFTDGGIHAREWISPATVTYFINELLTSEEPFMDSVDFYFMPVINPDGYSYTFTNDRLWRKTRSDNPGYQCKGTDPNRNWDFHWAEIGASDLPCAETYHGAQPFSEIEMQVVRDQLIAIEPRVYLTFHAYSQLWMCPWGWTSELPPNFDDMDSLAKAATAALTAVYGTTYETGTSTNTIYAAAGGSDDWAYGANGAEYAYTIELRDKGRYGFELPTEQIIPSGIETYEGFKVVAQFVADNPVK